MQAAEIGIVLGATAFLVLIRLAVPANVRENPRCAPVFVAGMAFAAFAGEWVGSAFR
jgi:hypothetical protein